MARLAEIGSEQEVARWWPGLDESDLRRKLDGEGTSETCYAIVHAGETVGLIESWAEDDPEYRHAGIDICLTSVWHGKRLGREAVRTLALHLVRDGGHHRVTIDPALSNERAIRCYEAVGFRRVGVLRRYWRGSDGEWHDGLLLDLLADELE